ncbi:hypothetical protein CU041_19155 [Thalassospira povalilytica]|uniref:Uncharacterized protein n=1 Tax=Thalassospira povalilytica TaxID=732237 RepID=A0ABX4R463_9PROT|nr:hypothetical protein CU041_19155 [Thalassospira povalilytica]
MAVCHQTSGRAGAGVFSGRDQSPECDRHFSNTIVIKASVRSEVKPVLPDGGLVAIGAGFFAMSMAGMAKSRWVGSKFRSG